MRYGKKIGGISVSVWRNKNVWKYAGAYVAFLVGSGFATGQEISQFYTSFGLWSIGSILLSLFLFVWVGGSMMKSGYHHRKDENFDVYGHYCGKRFGKLLTALVTIVLFCIVVMMISGAGAAMEEYYDVPVFAGSFIMAAAIYLSYCLGLNRIISVIGAIGPIIIVFSMAVGILALLQNPEGLMHVSEAMTAHSMKQGAPNWWVSGIFYSAYNVFGVVTFLFTLGKTAKEEKEAVAGGALGGVLLIGAIVCMDLAFLANLEEVAGLTIPTLYLADRISPVIGVLFSVVLLCGIFGTAAPKLWAVSEKFAKEGTAKGRMVALALIFVAYAGGQLPFETLIGWICPLTGCFGVVFMIALAFSQWKQWRKTIKYRRRIAQCFGLS